jgi:hypothetical protein
MIFNELLWNLEVLEGVFSCARHGEIKKSLEVSKIICIFAHEKV